MEDQIDSASPLWGAVFFGTDYQLPTGIEDETK